VARLRSCRRPRIMAGAAAAVVVAAATMVVTPVALAGTLSVNCDAGGDLQGKIEAAASGDTILVKGACVGNFQIMSKSLTLKGNPTATPGWQ
jgi:hypothetical protein